MLGDDFPKNLMEFETRFSTEGKCRDHLFAAKYPAGFICSKCGHSEFWWTHRHLMCCKTCGHQDSLRTGTVFQDSKKPLMLWYRAIFLISFQKTGISAKNLQQQLGFGSYQTAWTWLHKIRGAMRRVNRDKLSGSVEVDETYVGGSFSGKRGRGSENKTIVGVCLERKGQKLGRVRMDILPDVSAESIKKVVGENVEKNSIVFSDGLPSYQGLSAEGYKHKPLKSTNENKDKLLVGIHLVVSLFKRFMLGTHQGRFTEKHLQLFIDEFVFRFNRRKSANRGKVFYRLIDECIVHRALPYWRIIGRVDRNTPLGNTA